ncbi:MAG: hypothetical protein QF733_00200 [Phycisphaerales bacterium]|nr:hypothetical protein [Phycisphaerales bacterium]
MNTTGGRSSNWTIDLGIEEAMAQDLSAMSDQTTRFGEIHSEGSPRRTQRPL